MIVPYFDAQEFLYVYAHPADFTGHEWRHNALRELCRHWRPRAWGQHEIFRFGPEVELAVVLLIQPLMEKVQVLPDRVAAEEVLRTGRFPWPPVYVIADAGTPATTERLERAREAHVVEHEVVDARMVLDDGEEIGLDDLAAGGDPGS